MVKYNTNIDTSKVFLGTYDEWVKTHIDVEKSTLIGPAAGNGTIELDLIDTDNMSIGGYGNGFISPVFNYTGYLKFKTAMIAHYEFGGWHFYIDDQELQPIKTDNNGNAQFEFEGYIKETFEARNGADLSLRWQEFSTNPYNLSLSDDTFNTYYFTAGDNYINSEWGELIINETYKPTLKFNWYNPNNNIKTECLDTNYIGGNADQMDGPFLNYWGNIHAYRIFETDWPHSIVWWDPLIFDYSGEFYSTKTPSGWKDLGYNGEGLTTFPILIHKNDIGKQNTIGPLVRQDGTEIYINLTII